MIACFSTELQTGENPAHEDEMLYDLEAAASKVSNFDYRTENSDPAVPEVERQGAGQVSGAAVVGGLAGLVLVGPVMGLVAAGGAAMVATTKGSAGDAARKTGEKAGDVARKTREMTATAGKSIQSFGGNGIIEKTSSSVIDGYGWMTKKLSFRTKAEASSPSISRLP